MFQQHVCMSANIYVHVEQSEETYLVILVLCYSDGKAN